MKEENKAKQAELDAEVYDFIKAYNRKQRAVNDSELSKCVESSSRSVRNAIERLRENHIIWNFQDGKGYIIGETDTEEGNRLNDKWLAQEDNRAIKNFMHSKYARSKRNNPNQAVFDMDGSVCKLLESYGANEYNPVVEMYFEYMQAVCKSTLPIACGRGCKFTKPCKTFPLCVLAYDYTLLNKYQLTALEPYAIAWAESEGLK